MPLVLGGSGEKYATFTRPPRAGGRCTSPRSPRARRRAPRARARAPRPRGRAARRTRARAPRRVGATTSPVSRSRTMSSGPPASVVVTTGFSREERLVRDEPVVLVHRRVVDAEAARVEIGELVVGLTRPVNVARPSRPRSCASCSSRSRSGPSPAITMRTPGACAAASISRSIRFARSSRLTERMKSSYARRSGSRAAQAAARAPRRRARSSRAAGRRRSTTS